MPRLQFYTVQSIKSNFLMALKTIIALCFFIWTPVFANVLYQQALYDNLTTWSFGASTARIQYLGTGLSGTVKSISLRASWTGSGVQPSYYPLVLECSDSNYSISCSYVSDASAIAFLANTTVTDHNFNVPDFTFNSSKYYALIVALISGGENFSLHGLSYNSYDTVCVKIGDVSSGSCDSNIKDITFSLHSSDSETPIFGSEKTRILSLDPAHGSTTPSGNDVYFRARAYIADEPSFWDTIDIKLAYNDLNTIYSLVTTAAETTLYSGSATTTGIFDYSTTTPLSPGNYSVVFILRNSTLGGIVPNPFGGDSQMVRHNFVVGTSTFLGSINNNFTNDLNEIYGNLEATSTAELIRSCNPFLGDWDTKKCLAGLLLPDTNQMDSLMDDFRTRIVNKAPMGWAFRLYAIISGSATTTPPVLTFTIPDDPYFSTGLRGQSITFNPWNVVSDGSILDQADGFGAGNMIDTFMPTFKVIVYGLVVFGLVHRLFGISSTNTSVGKLSHGNFPVTSQTTSTDVVTGRTRSFISTKRKL